MSSTNHDTTWGGDATERYVLGEMDEDEAIAFEEHFFDCADCARDVREATIFTENAKVALRGPEPRPWWYWWTRPWVLLPQAATVVLGSVVIYMTAVTIPGLQRASAPQIVTPTILRVVRAELPNVELAPDATSFLLVIDVITPKSFPRYSCEFRSEGGETLATLETEAPEQGTLNVVLPAARFPEGQYTMILSGLQDVGSPSRETLETYRFRVTTRNSE